MLDVFPLSARIEKGRLSIGGLDAGAIVEEFSTPVVVYCEETIRMRARELLAAVPGATIAFASKAFPNVAILTLLREEGISVDVASPGELALALAAGHSGPDLIVHGNAKPDELIAAAAREGATLVLDNLEEVERAASASVRQAFVRVTLGVDADTHEAVKTGHHGSKFGLPPEHAAEAIARAIELGLPVTGLHVHVGSQVAGSGAHREAVSLLATFAADLQRSLRWTARTVDLGGGFSIRHTPEETAPDLTPLVRGLVDDLRDAWDKAGLERPEIVLEPGRALIGRAGVTLYSVESVKTLPDVTWVSVDGGMSDNPRPALYGARYTALSATRAGEAHATRVSLAGLHCESGDVLIDSVGLPPPRRGDIVAVPATGAYTLSMASNYNVTPRPAAVLVRRGQARTIRRRETVDDILRLEAG